MLTWQHLPLRPEHRTFINRFTTACEKDTRIVAAFLGGSYAKGYADRFSDVDVCVITTDASTDAFYEQRESFLRELGDLVFLEDFDLPHIAFFVFSDGTEGELYFGSEGHLDQIRSGAFRPLVDKKGLLAEATFPPVDPEPMEQREKLRREIYWFWHEVSHFSTALGRGQWWWARGQLDAMRLICASLARLRHNFLDPDADQEPFFKIENAMSVKPLASLSNTFPRLEKEPMLAAAFQLVNFYKAIAIPLAADHGIAYPAALEKVMISRLERLQN